MEECLIKDIQELQLTYLQVLVLIIETDCGEEWKNRYVNHIGTLQGLSEKYPELNRLIDRKSVV